MGRPIKGVQMLHEQKRMCTQTILTIVLEMPDICPWFNHFIISPLVPEYKNQRRDKSDRC